MVRQSFHYSLTLTPLAFTGQAVFLFFVVALFSWSGIITSELKHKGLNTKV